MPSVVLGLLETRLPPGTPGAASEIARAPTALDTIPAVPASAALTSPVRYECIGPLGEGGVGVVEHVRDRDLLRDVAVKHLRPELATHAAMLGQFLWEARVTAYLDHPNIVPVHDVGRTPSGQLYFTMKLVRGETLESALARAHQGESAVNLSRRLRWFLHLCNAIAYAHARGVLHRDLKPGNVMIGEYGEVLVTDWGLALPLPGDAGAALRALMPAGVAEISAGTPMYMSPEQARGEALDARSDVFTLGAILYEFAALRRAFEGENAAVVLAKVLGAEPAAFRDDVGNVPHSLLAIVRRATALEPENRYSSVRELADDVETVLDGRTPRAEHVSMVTRAARYYVARDPAISQLRVFDLDLLVASGFFVGIGTGALVAGRLAHLGWLAVALGFIAGIPPVVRWMRYRRNHREADAVSR